MGNILPCAGVVKASATHCTLRLPCHSLIDGTWGDDFRIIYDEILTKNDEFFVLADFDSYVQAHTEIERRYADKNAWAKTCLINIAKSWYFSSDRTIRQYAEDIWHIQPIDIE